MRAPAGRLHRHVVLLFALAAAGCAPASPPSVTPPTVAPPPVAPEAPAALPAAPWQGPALARTAVPAEYAQEWTAAENRSHCAPIAPASPGQGSGATPRRANFSGGWGIAYDLPELRSAFGVAGTGATAETEGVEYAWPHERRWADGSRAGYGPEGGSGPNQLAYLRIPGQTCLYNVWSRLGREHLEHLLEQLRFVEMAELPG